MCSGTRWTQWELKRGHQTTGRKVAAFLVTLGNLKAQGWKRQWGAQSSTSLASGVKQLGGHKSPDSLPVFFNSSNTWGHWLGFSPCRLVLQEVDLSYNLLAASDGEFMSSDLVVAELLCQLLCQRLLGKKSPPLPSPLGSS